MAPRRRSARPPPRSARSRRRSRRHRRADRRRALCPGHGARPGPRSFPTRRSSDLDSPRRGRGRRPPSDPPPAGGRRARRRPTGGARTRPRPGDGPRSEEHTSELQSQSNLVCRLLPEKKQPHRWLPVGAPPGRRLAALVLAGALVAIDAPIAVERSVRVTEPAPVHVLSLHDALPISTHRAAGGDAAPRPTRLPREGAGPAGARPAARARDRAPVMARDRKSTRLNSSHSQISYAVFCLKKNSHIDGSPSALRQAAASQRSFSPALSSPSTRRSPSSALSGSRSPPRSTFFPYTTLFRSRLTAPRAGTPPPVRPASRGRAPGPPAPDRRRAHATAPR